jgi:1,4-dihydroxy-2-naphthoyl-CoA hydrolase
MDEPLSLGSSAYGALLGIEPLDDDPDHARARIEVRDELRQPVGLMHGGVLSSVIEELCSRVTQMRTFSDGMVASGQSIEVSFLRPVTKGAAEIRASARHRGRTTWVWDAEVRDEDEKLCALGRMTVALRLLPAKAVGDR